MEFGLWRMKTSFAERETGIKWVIYIHSSSFYYITFTFEVYFLCLRLWDLWIRFDVSWSMFLRVWCLTCYATYNQMRPNASVEWVFAKDVRKETLVQEVTERREIASMLSTT